MRCPRCATILDDESWSCPGCGYPVRPRHHVVQIELWGNVIEVLGWLLLMLVAGILIIPGAWALAAVCRGFVRNLRFSDGRTAAFTGRGSEIVGWWILGAVAGGMRNRFFGVHIVNVDLLRIDFPTNSVEGALVNIARFLLGALASWMLIRWFVDHLEFQPGEHFRFEGGYGALLAWDVWVGLLVITIIGWAWGLAGMYNWMAESTRSERSALRFHGQGHQILWRTLVTLLLSVLIIPIPFALLWYAQWLVKSTTIEGNLAGDQA